MCAASPKYHWAASAWCASLKDASSRTGLGDRRKLHTPDIASNSCADDLPSREPPRGRCLEDCTSISTDRHTRGAEAEPRAPVDADLDPGHSPARSQGKRTSRGGAYGLRSS